MKLCVEQGCTEEPWKQSLCHRHFKERFFALARSLMEAE